MNLNRVFDIGSETKAKGGCKDFGFALYSAKDTPY